MDPVSFLFKCATHAAGSRLREIKKSRERAEAVRVGALEKARQERVAAQEKAREERDPVYRAAKVAERARAAAQREKEAARRVAEGIAWECERRRRVVQRWMFWLSFVEQLLMQNDLLFANLLLEE